MDTPTSSTNSTIPPAQSSTDMQSSHQAQASSMAQSSTPSMQSPTMQTSPLNTIPSTPGTPPPSQTMPTTEDASHKGGSGKLVFLLVFILAVVAAIGGYLLFSMYQKSQPQPDVLITPAPAEPVASPTAVLQEDPTVEELESVSSSDEVKALEEDVEASNFSTLNEEVSTLEQEL